MNPESNLMGRSSGRICERDSESDRKTIGMTVTWALAVALPIYDRMKTLEHNQNLSTLDRSLTYQLILQGLLHPLEVPGVGFAN